MASLDTSPLRIAVAGSVQSTRRTLQGLLRHRAHIVGVLGLRPDVAQHVSGYARLDDLAHSAHIDYDEFQDINHPDILETVRAWSVDLLFVVGLSQLVKPALLALPRLGCVGFHPTWLPRGRGRAPIAWLVLDSHPGAATFFLMDEGVDSGAILVQEPFYVSDQDYAADVLTSMEHAIDRALDRWLPALLAGTWHPLPQPETQRSYNGRRTPDDGLIDWSQSAQDIQALIRATSRPHPGAYTYLQDQKLIIWRAEIEEQTIFRGVTGRILHVDDQRGWLVQTGKGLIWLSAIEFTGETTKKDLAKLRTGTRLGYVPQEEIHILRQRLSKLEAQLMRLSNATQDANQDY